MVSISLMWRSRDKVSQVPLFQPVGSAAPARSLPRSSPIDQGAPPTPPEVTLPVDPEEHMSLLGVANNHIPDWLIPQG
jgi:hypothetical protein